MKRMVLLCAMLIFLTGCTSIQKSEIKTVIDLSLNSKMEVTNTNRKGYRYYLPKGLSIRNSDNYNDVIISDRYKLYLYVDIVSYNNKTDFKYMINEDAYFSNNILFNNKKGYIEINNYKNNQYLIEIMYNYAKIEVIVYEKDINSILAYAMSILTSITYNDSVIDNYLSNDILDANEESFDIFEIVGSDNYLQFKDEEISEDGIHDPDYVN